MVLAGFWTYTCINWLRQLPYLRAWAGKYAGHGLVVIGVHTPEFAFEHDAGNVRRAVRERRIGYPVAIGNDYAVWTAFANHYWPALYLADAHGRIRHHHLAKASTSSLKWSSSSCWPRPDPPAQVMSWSRPMPAAPKPRPTGPPCDHHRTTPATRAPRTSPPPAARSRPTHSPSAKSGRRTSRTRALIRDSTGATS